MRIKVTQADIQKSDSEWLAGNRGIRQFCPIAQAVMRHCEKVTGEVAVSYSYVNVKNYIYSGWLKIPRWGGGPLPDVAQNFIERYDMKLPVKPIEFDWEITENG